MDVSEPEGAAAAGTPLFTVTIATYNRCSELPSAIDRVCAQDFGDFELVVVDDGSADATAAVVTRWPDDRVRYVRRDNGGISAARNTGAEAARGRYLVFLDDDDIPDPGWLRAFADVVQGGGPALVTCGARYVDPEGHLLSTRTPAEGTDPWTGLYQAGTICVRRDAFEASGGFAIGLQCSHQTELSWRLIPVVEEAGWTYRAVARPLISIVRRGANERPESSPAKLLAGTSSIIERHQTFLEEHPATYRDYLGVAGVAAARLGRYREARRYFARAARVAPTDLKTLGRLATSLVPPLGRRVWRSEGAERRDPTRSSEAPSVR